MKQKRNGLPYLALKCINVYLNTISNGQKWFVDSDCYSTVFHEKTTQDSLTTDALMKFNILDYKQKHPEVKTINLQSDNAGNYKSSNFLKFLQGLNNEVKEHDIQIKSMKFSEPEDGKSQPDRYGGLQKRHAMRIVDAVVNIVNGTDLVTAIVSNGGIANVISVLAKPVIVQEEENDNEDSDDDDDGRTGGIPAIRSYHSFEFVENGVVAKKHGIIGEGKFFELSQSEIPTKFCFEIIPV